MAGKLKEKEIEAIIKNSQKLVLYGRVGTGKTTMAVNTFKGDCYILTLHADMVVQELIGHYIPKGGEFVWQDGVATRAWREGKPLILNEIDEAANAVMTILHALLDDFEVAQLTLPTGETIKPKEGYKVIATMNGKPEDLPIAVKDRLAVRIKIDTPPKGLDLAPAIQKALNNSYDDANPVMTTREAIAFNQLIPHVGMEAASLAVFGERGQDIMSVIKMLEEKARTAKKE